MSRSSPVVIVVDDNQEEEEEEVVLTETRTVFQAVGERARQAEQDGRMIYVDTNAAAAAAPPSTGTADGSLLGQRVYKLFFGTKWYFGTVTSIDIIPSDEDDTSCPFYYHVRYDDTDEEHLSWEEIQPLLRAAEQNAHKDPKGGAKQKRAAVVAAASTAASSPVRVKRERDSNGTQKITPAIVTPPPKKKAPPPRFEAHMWKFNKDDDTIPDWLPDFAVWLETQNMSAANAKSVLRQVTKLATGEGIRYKANWPDHVVFAAHHTIDLSVNFDDMMTVARQYEQQYGHDKGHGWLTRHPIKKLKLFQQHRGIVPTRSFS